MRPLSLGLLPGQGRATCLTCMVREYVRDDLGWTFLGLLQQHRLARQHKVDQTNSGTISNLHNNNDNIWSCDLVIIGGGGGGQSAYIARGDPVGTGAELQFSGGGLGSGPAQSHHVLVLGILLGSHLGAQHIAW